MTAITARISSVGTISPRLAWFVAGVAGTGALAMLAMILVTGYPSETSRQQAREVGAAAFLGKPFSLNEFGDLVQKLLAPPMA